jgi:hypothetical protein
VELGFLLSMNLATCAFREWFQGLWPAVACHFCYNATVDFVAG